MDKVIPSSICATIAWQYSARITSSVVWRSSVRRVFVVGAVLLTSVALKLTSGFFLIHCRRTTLVSNIATVPLRRH